LKKKDYFSSKIADLGESTSKFKNKEFIFKNKFNLTGTVKETWTPTHMAPEMLLFKQQYHKSDVYSFGSFLYELLTCDNQPLSECESIEDLKDFFKNKNNKTQISDDKIIVKNSIIRCSW